LAFLFWFVMVFQSINFGGCHYGHKLW
jgi:hypothetical protein